MKKFCIIIFAIFIFVFSGCNSEEFSKNINTRDLELVYTVYTESSISVEITPLVDIQNLKVQICYYQDSNILRQDNEWLELEFLEKGNTYHLMYDLSESYPFDRVALYNISGKKKNNTEPTKIGFVVSKKIHKRAVKRNRIKRLMRESMRLYIKECGNFDTKFMSLVFVASTHLLNKNFADINKGMRKLLEVIKNA